MKKLLILLILLSGCDNHTDLQKAHRKAVFEACLTQFKDIKRCNCYADKVYNIDDETWLDSWNDDRYGSNAKIDKQIYYGVLECLLK